MKSSSAPIGAALAASSPARLSAPTWIRRSAMLTIAAVASAFGVITVGSSHVRAADPIDPVPLGLVETFGILTSAAVGNAAPEPVTVIRGDVGSGGALTGFPPGIITGVSYIGATVNPMMADLQAAYNDAAERAPGTPLPAELGGKNFGPGVHTTVAAAGTAADMSFTIDGEDNPDSVFIFQVGGALAFGANTSMTLINGAQAKNVFWQVGGAGTLGANNEFVGTLIASTAVTAGAGSTVNGRLTSLTGAVTISSTQLYSAPPTVSITGGPTAYTDSSTPLIAGTTSARTPMTVTVAIDGVDQAPDVSPSENGNWSYQAPLLANGEHTIVARSIDGAGNVGSFVQTLTVDTTPPVVTIDGAAAAVTNDLTPAISGTTDVTPGQIVTLALTRVDPAASLTRTALVQTDQTWSIAPSGVTEGTWTIVATVADPAGNESTATLTLTIDATAPLAAIASSALTNDPNPTIHGTAETGAIIAVSIGGRPVTDIVHGAVWSAATNDAHDHGTHHVAVTATDAAGNSIVLAQTLDVDLIVPLVAINPGPIDSTNDTTPTIIGTTDVAIGQLVHVSIDGGTALVAVAQVDGWNVTPSASLSLGRHTVVATVTDPPGNTATATQTLTIDTSDPTDPPTTPPSTNPPTTPPPAVPAAFTAVGPKRVFDTRFGASPNALRNVAAQQVSGGYVLEVQMTALVGFVPADGVGAVSLNVTSTGSAAAGYITVYACGFREHVSSVNFAAGRTVANAVIAPVSASGTVCFYASAPTDIVVDVNGWLAAGAAFAAVGPVRVFDTRAGASPNALRQVPATKLAAGTMLEVRLTELAGYVPADGVDSVSLNVVVTNPESPGYITVYACGERKVVSSVNYVAGQTVANAVIAPVSPSGTVCFYTLANTDMAVDINGWIASGSSFHGVSPGRVLDTRLGAGPGLLRAVPQAKVGGDVVLEVQVTDLPGFTPATGVSAVSLNVTATNTGAPGFVTVFSCGPREAVSSVNYDAGVTVANAVLAPVSDSGTICLFSKQPIDLVVDINGWIGAGVG